MVKQPVPITEPAGVDAGLVEDEPAKLWRPAIDEDGYQECAREACGSRFKSGAEKGERTGFRAYCSDECAIIEFYRKNNMTLPARLVEEAAASGREDVDKEAVLTMKSGPLRDIVEVLSETPTGKSVRVRLACDHETTALKTAKTVRCRACRDMTVAIARIEPITIPEGEDIVDAVTFCKLFSPVLIREEWGDLDPTWFQEIATEPNPTKLSRDARLLWEDLTKALTGQAPSPVPTPTGSKRQPMPMAPAAPAPTATAAPAVSKRQPISVTPPAAAPSKRQPMPVAATPTPTEEQAVTELVPVIEAYLTAKKDKTFTPEMVKSAATHAVRTIVEGRGTVPSVTAEAAVELAVQQEKTADYWTRKGLAAEKGKGKVPVSAAAEPTRKRPVPMKPAAKAKKKPAGKKRK